MVLNYGRVKERDMEEALKNFNQQFGFEPKIENEEKLGRFSRFVVCGMGGSHLAADLIRRWQPPLALQVWSDYGLPPLTEEELRASLLVASSYSGNTEEVIDAFERARAKGLPLAAISVGGQLLERAREHKLPYVQLPDKGLQPRSALGFSLRALLKLMGQEAGLRESAKLAKGLEPTAFKTKGKALAEKLKGKIPVIYSSTRNRVLAYNWKIKFNETGKIPAFDNVLPELNHNEMMGFDVKETTKELSARFHFIFIKDRADHPQILKRMKVLAEQYQDRGLPVEEIELEREDTFYRLFANLILADWTALYTARQYGLEPEEVAMIEEFKKLIR